MNAEPIVAFTLALKANGVKYGLGSKAKSLNAKPSEYRDQNGGKAIDCSGFVRYLLHFVFALDIPDGSVNQRDWIKANGFKKCAPSDVGNKDGAVRIAFLPPIPGVRKVGHVMLVVNGETCESHGGKGPNMRAWNPDKYHFMHDCVTYVLCPPV